MSADPTSDRRGTPEAEDKIGAAGNCPFCTPDATRVWLSNEHALAVYDGFPLARGHTLVVPRQHVACLFDLPPDVQQAVWRLVALARERLVAELHPDGFNVGLNDGRAAGQTVMHTHIHTIPRYTGDVPDPRGGVRFVIPEKAKYWQDASERAKIAK